MLKVKQYSQEATYKTYLMYCVMSRDKSVAIPDADNVVSQLVKSQNSEKKKISHREAAKLHHAV